MRTCLNQPVRTIWAKAAASFRSVLFGRILSAAFAWRASMQTTGKPFASSSFQSHTARGPVSIPIRTRPVAFSANQREIVSGQVALAPHFSALVNETDCGGLLGYV